MEVKQEKTITMKRKKKVTLGDFLRLIKKTIMQEPGAYNQSAVFPPKEGRPHCGSPACIAGWMEFYLYGVGRPYEKINQDLFGEHRWPWLFNAGFKCGPKDIQGLQSLAKTPELRAAVACYAIDVYAKEMGVEL